MFYNKFIMLEKISVLFNLLIGQVIYLISIVRFHNIWKFKKYLYDRKNKNFLFKRSFVHAFDKRLKKYCSWIGYDAEIKGVPVLPHGISGLYISGGGVIGCNCVIYQQVTIGSNTLRDSQYFGSPTIGDNVLIGAGAKIIGKVKVGNNVRIGANAVVARDVPDNSVVVSNGRVIQKEGILDNRFYSFSETKGKWGYYKDGCFVVDDPNKSNNINDN